MAIPDPPKAGSPFCALWTGGWNPKTPKINNFFIPEITLRGGYGIVGGCAVLVRAPVNFPRPGALAGFSLTFFSKLPSAEEAGSAWAIASGCAL